MAKSKNRIIFHVDMDHFFTAVEEREHPEYKGKPVVVGADPKEGKGRGVVSTCNYEARKYGIRSGMPITRAWRRCPHAVYLPVNYDLYRKVSSRIMAILRRFADKFEQWGLDEAFLDVTSKVQDLEEAKRLARKIKREIYEKEKLTCSVGIGPNKLVAKIASDFKKPDGLTVVEERDVKKFLSPLPVEKLLWVGKKTKRKLNAIGIKTIGDLANFDASVLTEKFGIMGRELYLSAQGIDRSEVQERWEIKSMSRDKTFEEDTSDTKIILKTLNTLAEDVHKQLIKSNFNLKTVTIKIRYENFETHTHSKTLPFITDRLSDIRKTAGDLIQAYLQPDRKVRLIGVKISKLVSSEKQKKLI
jgi:DNA polymerase IV (DinB-like DNA polymerase)